MAYNIILQNEKLKILPYFLEVGGIIDLDLSGVGIDAEISLQDTVTGKTVARTIVTTIYNLPLNTNTVQMAEIFANRGINYTRWLNLIVKDNNRTAMVCVESRYAQSSGTPVDPSKVYLTTDDVESVPAEGSKKVVSSGGIWQWVTNIFKKAVLKDFEAENPGPSYTKTQIKSIVVQDKAIMPSITLEAKMVNAGGDVVNSASSKTSQAGLTMQSYKANVYNTCQLFAKEFWYNEYSGGTTPPANTVIRWDNIATKDDVGVKMDVFAIGNGLEFIDNTVLKVTIGAGLAFIGRSVSLNPNASEVVIADGRVMPFTANGLLSPSGKQYKINAWLTGDNQVLDTAFGVRFVEVAPSTGTFVKVKVWGRDKVVAHVAEKIATKADIATVTALTAVVDGNTQSIATLNTQIATKANTTALTQEQMARQYMDDVLGEAINTKLAMPTAPAGKTLQWEQYEDAGNTYFRIKAV